jgi:tRNA dimethylallyltransferase
MALAARDPATAERLRPSDSQRILRALEFHAATGAPLSAYQANRVPGPLRGRRLAKIFVAPDRAELRDRIDRRFLAMMEAGALDEVAGLAMRGLDPALPVMRAHGVPGLLAHLRGQLSLDEAVARGQTDTRAYVKRQFTWGRHQMPDFAAVSPEAAFAAAMELIAA